MKDFVKNEAGFKNRNLKESYWFQYGAKALLIAAVLNLRFLKLMNG